MRAARITFQLNEVNNECSATYGTRVLCRARNDDEKRSLSAAKVPSCQTLRKCCCALTCKAKKIQVADIRLC